MGFHDKDSIEGSVHAAQRIATSEPRAPRCKKQRFGSPRTRDVTSACSRFEACINVEQAQTFRHTRILLRYRPFRDVLISRVKAEFQTISLIHGVELAYATDVGAAHSRWRSWLPPIIVDSHQTRLNTAAVTFHAALNAGSSALIMKMANMELHELMAPAQSPGDEEAVQSISRQVLAMQQEVQVIEQAGETLRDHRCQLNTVPWVCHTFSRPSGWLTGRSG